MNAPSALEKAKTQLGWYTSHKKTARISYYVLEGAIVTLTFVVAIAGITDADAAIAAVAGALIIALAALRQFVHWQENWIGFARAEAQLAKAIDFYEDGVSPYDGPDRDQRLTQRMWEVREGETEAWSSRVASSPPVDPGAPAPAQAR